MDRADWGKMLFYSFCLAESFGLFGFGTLSTIEVISVVASLGVILPFVVGYLIANLGLLYGLVLGIAPAMFAILALPSRSFGASPVVGLVVLLLACPLLSALSGLVGQRLALRRHAA
jgi:hypothetical protein